MNERAMIEASCNQHGLTILSWSTTEDGETAALGKFVVTTNDCEGDGLYEGDEGTLSASVVGAEKYNNQRVHFSFVTEDMDEGNEVRDLYALDPVDD